MMMLSKIDHISLLEIPSNVDMQFSGGDDSYILYPNISTVDEFTLTIWVRFLGKNSAGLFVSLINVEDKSGTVFFSMSHSDYILNVGKLTFESSFGKSINDGRWHHIIVHMSGITTKVQIQIDKGFVYDELENDIKKLRFFRSTGSIMIGQRNNQPNKSTFMGEIGQVAIFNRELSLEEKSTLIANCSVNMTGKLHNLLSYMFSS